MANIGVIGAGAFGTALANVLAESGNKVFLFSRRQNLVDDINKKHKHNLYKNILLDKNLVAVNDIKDIVSNNILLIVVPSNAFVFIMNLLKQNKWSGNLLICTKGLDAKSGNFLSDVSKNILDSNNLKSVAVLSGPSFAKEIIEHNFTWFSFAGSKKFYNEFEKLIKNDSIKLSRTDDLIGVQFAGAFKNVVALAMGVLAEENKSENAKAALLTLGFNEMKQIGFAYGAKKATFDMPSGFGDLVLTATSKTSRNYECGMNLAKHNIDFSCNVLCEGIEAFYIIEKMVKQKKLNSQVINFLKDYIR